MIDLKNKTISGIGKNQKEYELAISDSMAERLSIWMTQCPNPNQPFQLFKEVPTKENPLGVSYKNQRGKFHRKFVKECNRLGITAAEGNAPTIHCARHFFARSLKEQGWNIESIATAMRHSKIDTTRIYMGDTTKENKDKMREKFKKEEGNKQDENRI